jgi:hypothetical protein
MGNGQKGTRTKTDRDTDRQGQGHKRTGKGIQPDMDRDKYMDMDNFNGQLTKNKSIEALSFKKFYKIEFYAMMHYLNLKNKRSSVKLTFSK